MTVPEAETAIGALVSNGATDGRPITLQFERDQERKSKLRALVRKWLSANGLPSSFVMALSYIELEKAYNDPHGAGLAAVQKKYEQARAEDADAFEDDGDAAPVAAPAGKEAQALEVLRGLFGNNGALTEAQIRTVVQNEIAKVTFPRDVVVRVNDAAPIKLDGQHPIFDRVLNLVARNGNVMLVGPAGCGKTHLAAQIAKALGRDYGFISGTAGASESHLTGWLLPVDGGKFEYAPAQFVTLYEQGNSLFCFDEMDSFDANMLMVSNVATANGHMVIPHRRDNPIVTRGPNMGFIATANTFGTGANPIYAARNQLDGATLDRWIIVEMDYDRAFEEKLALSEGLTVAELSAIWSLRDKVREAGLRRVISTRAIQKVAISKASGESWQDTMAMLVCGWTKDEKAKAGL